MGDEDSSSIVDTITVGRERDSEPGQSRLGSETMTDRELESIMIADALRYAARYRREGLQFKPKRRSRDNVGAHDGHKPNTYRAFPRTGYSNPDALEGTSPSMVVTLADGSEHIVPATRNWRNHVKHEVSAGRTVRTHTAHASEFEAIGDVD
jgi:hypothetical protein